MKVREKKIVFWMVAYDCATVSKTGKKTDFVPMYSIAYPTKREAEENVERFKNKLGEGGKNLRLIKRERIDKETIVKTYGVKGSPIKKRTGECK